MEAYMIIKRSAGMKIIRKVNVKQGIVITGIYKGELVRVEQQRWFLRLARD